MMIVAATAASIVTPMAPAAAHGENDARVIARGAEIGPHTVSLWNVLGDAGSDLPAHLIVMVDGTPISDDSVVVVEAGSHELAAVPSTTIDRAWETTSGVVPGEHLVVRVESPEGRWSSERFVVPAIPEPNGVSRFIGSFAVFVTAAAVYWLGKRAGRVWRRPLPVHA